MSPSLLLRVCVVSLTLSAFSFLAGLAGDFAQPPPASGTTVVLRIPPAIPSDAPQPTPLSALPRTAAAAAQGRSAPISIAPVAQAPLPPGPVARMVLDHEFAHSAVDAAYAADGERLG